MKFSLHYTDNQSAVSCNIANKVLFLKDDLRRKSTSDSHITLTRHIYVAAADFTDATSSHGCLC